VEGKNQVYMKTLIALNGRLASIATLCKKLLVLGFIVCAVPTTLMANPTGGNVSAGSATISNGNDTTTITQTSSSAVVDWNTFNISANETTKFVQPSSSAITLNRINGSYGASSIYGKLNANGQVWLVNPAGIFFGASAQVNVGSLLATTANITNADFMAGNYHFMQQAGWNGSVINMGKITVAQNGLVALVAPGVANSGTITARLGTVVLAAGNEFTVDFYGDNLIQFGVNNEVTAAAHDQNGKVMANAVSNSGKIFANGGKVLLSADTAENIVNNTINMSGLIEADSASEKNGEIILSGGDNGTVAVSGTIKAEGKKAGQTGGTVTITGDVVELNDNAKINTSGQAGGGNVVIGGDLHGTGPDQDASYTFVGSNASIIASALDSGNGGQVTVWSNLGTDFYGDITANGGINGGNGGFVETSGHDYLDAEGNVSALALNANGTAGNWLLDPENVTISTGTQTNISTATASGTETFTPTGASAIILNTNINTALNAGTNVTVTTGSTGTQAGTITVTGAISKSSGTTTDTLTLTAASTIAINAAIGFTSGGLNVILNSSGAVTQTGAITASSLLVSAGAGAITLASANKVSGEVTLTNTGANNVSFTNSVATILGKSSGGTAFNVGGNLTITSTSGNITQTDGLTVAGTSSFSAGAHTIALTNTSNAFTGAVSLSNTGANAAAVSNNGAIVIGTTTVGSTLAVDGTTGITQTGVITAAGLATFDVTSYGSVTLNTSANKFNGGVAVTGSLQNIALENATTTANTPLTLPTTSLDNVTLTYTSEGIVLPALNMYGTLTVSAGGNISQSGVVSTSGSTSLTVTTANSSILLSTYSNTFNSIPTITNNGDVSTLDLQFANYQSSITRPDLIGYVKSL
jgi:filamentous hemagglutinin family protein